MLYIILPLYYFTSTVNKFRIIVFVSLKNNQTNLGTLAQAPHANEHVDRLTPYVSNKLNG